MYGGCAGEVWTEGGFTLALFQGGVWGVEQVQLKFSFRNKLIILLSHGLLVDNNTFSKMCVFKSLTGYTNYGGFVVKRGSAFTHIRVNDQLSPAGQFSSMDNPLPSVFVHDQQQL